MRARLRRFLRNGRGATSIEYGLIAALISIAILGGVGQAGNAIKALWGTNTTGILRGLQQQP